MSGIKGYPSNQKLPLGSGISFDHVAVLPTDEYKSGIEASRFAFRVGGNVARTAAANTGNIDGMSWVYDTATPAKKGDFIRFESGSNQYLEVPIVKKETNRFMLGACLSTAPASGDTFYIMRYSTQRVESDGTQLASITPSPVLYVKDGVDTEVEIDTVTPANTNALPVALVDSTGAALDPSSLAQESTLSTLASFDFATQTTLAAMAATLSGMEADLADINTGTPDALGQQNMAGSQSVVIASDQSAIPISAASLPLPTGAATEATLASLAAEDFATQTTLAALLTELQLKADLSETQPVSAASLPLPTGAATEATLSAAATDLNTLAGFGFATETTLNQCSVDLSSIAAEDFSTETTLAAMSAKLPAALGQTTMANSLSVTLASNQSSLPVAAGRSKVAQLYNDYTSTSVSTAAYNQLTASTASAVNKIEIFDSSGEVMILAVGAAASEVDQLYIFPGGNGPVDLYIPASSRISIKAKTATASVGLVAINLYS